MKTPYRIKEVTEVLDNATIKTTYYPQYSFKLFWLFPIYRNYPLYDDVVQFKTKEEAEKYLKNISSPNVIKRAEIIHEYPNPHE